jgi:hypothetical protein
MFKPCTRRMISCLAVAALFFVALPADPLRAGSGVHEGKWKVTTAVPTQFLYLNESGVTHTAVVTVCVSGGSIDIFAPTVITDVNAPECLSLATSLINGSNVHVTLLSGTSASGTYQVTVNP